MAAVRVDTRSWTAEKWAEVQADYESRKGTHKLWKFMMEKHGVTKNAYNHRIRSGKPAEVSWGRPALLTVEEEMSIREVIFTNQRNNLSLTMSQLLRLLRELTAGRQEKPISDSYVNSFLSRHPDIRLFKATKVTKARNNACTPEVFNAFFDILEPVLNEFAPERLFIADETGIDSAGSVNVSLICYE
jgi:hypothetical protein